MTYKRTTKSEEAIAAAIQQATADGNPQVEPVHLLLALLQQPDGMIQPVFERVGADLSKGDITTAQSALSTFQKAHGHHHKPSDASSTTDALTTDAASSQAASPNILDISA